MNTLKRCTPFLVFNLADRLWCGLVRVFFRIKVPKIYCPPFLLISLFSRYLLSWLSIGDAIDLRRLGLSVRYLLVSISGADKEIHF